MMALLLCAAGVPLLPTNQMKVTATLLAGCVLLLGVCVSARSHEMRRRTALDVPVAAFAALAIFSTALAVNPLVSLLPSAARGEGLLDYLVYLPMALAAARLSRLEVGELLGALLVAAALEGAVGIGQYNGYDATRLIGGLAFHYNASWGTLANPDFLGGYASLILPIGVAMAAGTREPRAWWGCAVATTLLYAALLGSQTRSAWAASALAAVILVRFLPRSPQTYRRLAMLAAAFAAVTIVMTLTKPQVSFAGRAESALNPADSSMQGRLWIWEHTIPMIAERPLLGWGFSGVLGHLPGIGTPGYRRVFGDSEVLIDVAHNDVLQVAVNMGLLGLAAYLWIWVTVIRAARGAARASAPPVGAEAAGILAGLIAYAVWLQFLWSHIGDANVFWVVAGVAVSLSRTAREPGAGMRPAI